VAIQAGPLCDVVNAPSPLMIQLLTIIELSVTSKYLVLNKQFLVNIIHIIHSRGSWAQLYPQDQVGSMYIFNTGPNHHGNRRRYCANVPISFACPALSRCGGQIPFPIPVNPLPLPSRCVCNGRFVTTELGGQIVQSGLCNFRDINDPARRLFCYVDPSPTCTDWVRSRVRSDLFASYSPCNNFAIASRGGRDGEEGVEDEVQDNTENSDDTDVVV